MEISHCFDWNSGHRIATNCCTCHKNTAVVPCANFRSDRLVRIDVRVKQNSHRIWNAMEKPWVKWVLVSMTTKHMCKPCAYVYECIQVMLCAYNERKVVTIMVRGVMCSILVQNKSVVSKCFVFRCVLLPAHCYIQHFCVPTQRNIIQMSW